MDTYAFVDSDISSVFTVTVVSATLDTDGDGVLDVDEECEHGTDINDADTDNDGLDDGDEVDAATDPSTPTPTATASATAKRSTARLRPPRHRHRRRRPR
jgi:hypothetical protein